MTKYKYFEQLAEHPIEWIENNCVHYIGEKKDQPFLLMDWQKEIVRNIFGWRVEGKEKYFKHTTIWLEIPRGNGKSTFATALGLYIAFGFGLDSSKVYCFASSKDQSKESVFDPAKHMAESINEKYGEGLYLYHNTVKDPETDSEFKLMSADWKGAHSLVGSAFIVDEIHLHTNDKLFSGVESGDAKRTDIASLIIICTTSGEQDTFGYEKHLYAKAVLEGKIKDDSWLVYIYSAGDQPKDDAEYYFREETWRSANPGFEYINQYKFRGKAQRAKASKSFLNTFLRYNLNIWMGSSSSFIPQHEWDQCNKGKVDLGKLRGHTCYAGFHFMYVRDLIAFTLFFPGFMVLKRWFWCPRVTLEDRSVKDHRFSDWRDHGYIREVSGNAHDFKDPMELIEQLVDIFDIASFNYRCASPIFEDWLGRFGIKLEKYALTHGQISAPTTKLEELVINKEINHQGNPVSDYMMKCVAVVSKDDQIKISPEKSSDRVPGPLADVMAIAGWMNEENEDSVTLEEGVQFFEI